MPELGSADGMADMPTVVSASEEPESDPPTALTLESVLEPLRLLFHDLIATPDGLSSRETARRLVTYGPNELRWHPVISLFISMQL